MQQQQTSRLAGRVQPTEFFLPQTSRQDIRTCPGPVLPYRVFHTHHVRTATAWQCAAIARPRHTPRR